MKLSRKIKLYSSLASFAVLGGIAITAASCAETSSTEKSSSPETDNKQPAASESSGGGGQLVLNQQNLLKQNQAVLTQVTLMANQKLVKKLDQFHLKLAANKKLAAKVLIKKKQAMLLYQEKWMKDLMIQKTALVVLRLLTLLVILKLLIQSIPFKNNKALIYFKFIV